MKRNGKDRARDQTGQKDSDYERRNDSDRERMDWDEKQGETARAGNQRDKTRIEGGKTRIRKKDFKSRRTLTERERLG